MITLSIELISEKSVRCRATNKKRNFKIQDKIKPSQVVLVPVQDFSVLAKILLYCLLNFEKRQEISLAFF